VLHNKPTTVAMSNVREQLAHTTDHITLRSSRLIATHTPNQTTHNFYFIQFVSSELGMCDRLNSLVCNDRLNTQ